MERIFATLAILALGLAAGCHAQVPPASPGYNVNLTATAPVATGNWAGCTTSAPCTYAVYAETLASATASCDATTSTNYKEITNPASRPSTPAFTDANATGLTRCYDMETVQGVNNSGPSNVAGPVVVPGIPLAPTLATPSPTVAALSLPMANPVIYGGSHCFDCFMPIIPAPVLTAKLMARVDPPPRR